MEKFTITTSIPYANAVPHIGFALEAIQADVLARYHREQGRDVFFLTGTDEHGTKIARAAEQAGLNPQEFVDGIAVRFQELTKTLNISNTDFIRTTDRERHWPAAQEVWRRLQENGDLYKDVYHALYCPGCEAFLTEKELVDGLCPIHKIKPEEVHEENYFFRLSKYADRLKELLEQEELRIVPATRKAEALHLIGQGLQDVSFSRPKEKLAWGIPVPGDEEQTQYVWVDALSNYISALGYPAGENFNKYWPADVHVIGKDILRFHALIWPAMLLSLGVELPKTLFVHGFITVEGQKMSKSLGNVIDPFELVEKYGTDPVRYYFLREISPTQDGDFSYEKFEARYNGDLANGLGNLASRILKMAKDYGVNPELSARGTIIEKSFEQLDEFAFDRALEILWSEIHNLDQKIQETEPFKLVKTDPDKAKKIVEELVVRLHVIATALAPFLPETALKLADQIEKQSSGALFPRLA